MYTCSACLRRAIDNLPHDLSLNSHPNVYLRSLPLQLQKRPDTRLKTSQNDSFPFRQHYRSHTSLATLRKGHHRQGFNKYIGKKENTVLGSKRRKAAWGLTKNEKKDALAREKNRLMMRKVQDDEDVEDEDVVPDKEVTHGKNGREGRPVKEEEELAVKEKERRDNSERALIAKSTRDIEKYYKDPLQLANGVTQRLRVPDIEGALRLVRASEHFYIDNIVSWNHCIDYLMSQGETRDALKLYNEMKKRGRRPDAHTYTIMLRGFSKNVNKPRSVQEAVKVYNSIFAPNSSVSPSTIHTNAIINVCARGGDLDSLWSVAGRLPEFGPGSPDRWTFTTILNAIRDKAIKDAVKLVDNIKTRDDREEAEKFRTNLFEQAVNDGRKLWQDINHRWRRANLVLDEQLVCAMGRLLLGCGKGKDLEQVFDLVDTTMNLRIPERRGVQRANWLQLQGPQEDNENTTSDASDASDAPEDSGQETYVPAVMKQSQIPLSSTSVYANPGNNTLSLILDACNLYPVTKHLAKSYWYLLTSPSKPHAIKPDANNILSYLRVLRRNRASRECYQLLAEDWPADVAKYLYKRGTFIIAFSTCARDKNNPNVFDTAVKLLRLMEQKLEETALGIFDENMAVVTARGKEGKIARQKYGREMANATEEDAEEALRRREGIEFMRVDPKALRLFLEVAVSTTPGWNEGIRFKDTGEVFPRDPAQNHTITALRMVGPLTTNLKHLLQLKMEEMQSQGLPRPDRFERKDLWDPRSGSRVGERTEELMELLRTMIGAYDRVLHIADRFESQDLEKLDKKLLKDFDNSRRQCAGYMAKIDKNLTKTLRSMTKVGDEAVLEDENDNDGDESQHQPQVLQQLESIYTDVDRQILDSRFAEKNAKAIRGKGFRHAKMEQSSLTKPKIISRIQAKERENLLDRQMRRQFPEADYGELDENLEVVEDPIERKKANARERRKGLSLGMRGPDSVVVHELKRDDVSDVDLVDALVNSPELERLSEEDKHKKATEIITELEERGEVPSEANIHTEAEKWYAYANKKGDVEGPAGEDESKEIEKMLEQERIRTSFFRKKPFKPRNNTTILDDASVQQVWKSEHERSHD